MSKAIGVRSLWAVGPSGLSSELDLTPFFPAGGRSFEFEILVDSLPKHSPGDLPGLEPMNHAQSRHTHKHVSTNKYVHASPPETFMRAFAMCISTKCFALLHPHGTFTNQRRNKSSIHFRTYSTNAKLGIYKTCVSLYVTP